MGSENLDIQDLGIGLSRDGMLNYIEAVRAELLIKVKEQINEVTDLEAAINGCWQGESRDAFLEDFKQKREEICKDLDKEYEDLKNRLLELGNNFYHQDRNMYVKN